MKRLIVLLVFGVILGVGDVMSQTTSEIRVLTKDELDASIHVPIDQQNQTEKVMSPCGANAPNDNFANAQNIVVGAAAIQGSVCGTLEPGETYGCVTTPNMSIWYSFVATASTQYVQATLLSGSCYFGCVIYGSLTGVPTSTCAPNGPSSQYPISCQSGSGGPITQLHQLTGLTVGATYYIQITQNSACAQQSIFTLQVTASNPGGTITNPPPLNSCATASPGCYFLTPPLVAATVTAACQAYSLTGAGYNANSVWWASFQYTNSATVSNVSLQAIITSNCGAGNVSWFNWRLYDCGCNLISCGTINNLTVQGLACGTCYRFEYMMELANCSSFVTIWPYQNIPTVPIPCTVLPLNLIYFNADVDQDKEQVNLTWETASETGIREFRLEKGVDEVNFKPLVSGIPAYGPGYKYSFADRSIDDKKATYYKLIAINTKGAEEYSKIIVLVPQIKHRDINLVPNPASNSVDIVLDESKTYSVIDIYNSLGQKVKSITPELNSTKFSVDLSDLSKGIYFVNVITSDDEVISKKLIKE
jgi:hypothetical protein